MKDLPVPKLVFNGTGGCLMTDMCRILKSEFCCFLTFSNTMVVTYNESSNQCFQLNASEFLLNSLSFQGFNMNWLVSYV